MRIEQDSNVSPVQDAEVKGRRTYAHDDLPDLPSASRRARVNAHHRLRALEEILTLIVADPSAEVLAWLVGCARDEVVTLMAEGDPEARAKLACSPKLKATVLTELGREADDLPAMLSHAQRICELKPATAKEAVALVRSWRLGRAPEAEYLALRGKVLDAIEGYQATHEGVESEMIYDVLRDAAWRVATAAELDVDLSWAER